MRSRRGGIPRLPRDDLRTARTLPRSHRHQPRSHQARARRACRDGVRPSRGPHHRRGRTHDRSAAHVRRRPARGQLDRRTHRPRPTRPHPLATAGHPPTRHPAGAGGRIRGEQLPAGVLGGRRRHRVGPRSRLPGGGQGARRASRHLRAGRPRHHRRGHCRRPAQGDVLAAVRLGPRARRRAGHRPADQGRRIHRIPFRRNRSGRRGRRSARAHPGLRRDEFDQPGVPARRGIGEQGSRPWSRLRRLAHDGVGPVLHQPRAGDRRRRARPRRLHRCRERGADAVRRPPRCSRRASPRTTPRESPR